MASGGTRPGTRRTMRRRCSGDMGTWCGATTAPSVVAGTLGIVTGPGSVGRRAEVRNMGAVATLTVGVRFPGCRGVARLPGDCRNGTGGEPSSCQPPSCGFESRPRPLGRLVHCGNRGMNTRSGAAVPLVAPPRRRRRDAGSSPVCTSRPASGGGWGPLDQPERMCYTYRQSSGAGGGWPMRHRLLWGHGPTRACKDGGAVASLPKGSRVDPVTPAASGCGIVSRFDGGPAALQANGPPSLGCS